MEQKGNAIRDALHALQMIGMREGQKIMISNEPTNSGHRFCRILGIFMIALGLMIAIYFRAFYSISVPGFHSRSRIQDIGLLQAMRQDRISGGVELSIIGALILFSSKQSTNTEDHR